MTYRCGCPIRVNYKNFTTSGNHLEITFFRLLNYEHSELGYLLVYDAFHPKTPCHTSAGLIATARPLTKFSALSDRADPSFLLREVVATPGRLCRCRKSAAVAGEIVPSALRNCRRWNLEGLRCGRCRAVCADCADRWSG